MPADKRVLLFSEVCKNVSCTPTYVQYACRLKAVVVGPSKHMRQGGMELKDLLGNKGANLAEMAKLG